MKKIFTIFLALLLLFVSCAKIEDMSIRNINLNETEIVFSTNTTMTKAIIDGNEMKDHFGVYGWVVPGTYSGDGGYLMKNAEYDKDGNSASGSYYWPISDNTSVDFIFTAYSQYYNSPVENDDENGTITITIPEISQDLINSGEFNDVLYAQTKVTDHQSALAEHSRVQLNFTHALSWLQFYGEVANNTSVKWVKIKSVKFEQWQEGQEEVPYNPGQEYIAPYTEITDTWLNLRRSSNIDGSATKLKGPNETTYTNAASLPESLVNEIKSYYSINGGDPGNYSLNTGATAWPSAEIRKLRVVKDIPNEYKITVEMPGSTSENPITMDFFDGFKYLKDNGYDIQPANSGGKPAIWNYILVDAYVNGSAYTVIGFNWTVSKVSAYIDNAWTNIPTLEHTVIEHEGQEYIAPTEYQPAIQEGYIADGIYSGGTIVLPTKSLIQDTPIATYDNTEEKVTGLNYCTQEWTINTNENKVLSSVLVVPQTVPEYITVVFDICINNATGDPVVITDRKISRKINSGKDNLQVDYTSSWLASNKYIYKFKFDGDIIDFSVSTSSWSIDNTHNYHVWDYTE